MVDFNNETTIGTPASDVEKISILQRRYELIEALEHYKKQNFQGINAPLVYVQARLLSLFVQLYSSLKRRIPKTDFEALEKGVLRKDLKEAELLPIIFMLSDELDKIHLTRIDNETVYDSTSVEKENKVKGY
jgi:hypothetical protein